MEPLPLPTTITTTPSHHHNAGSIPLNYPDSGESSPLSSRDWEDPLPLVPGGARLRLMCSYGGHIIPRPHDKSLCYVGGDTRIVVVDRRSSLSDLSSRLSRTLLNGRPFTLKYQLPAEDLDSLISVTTDEDLDNMADEYDRTAASPSRLRLFLFFLKPETTASMGALLDDAKSETWFVDALNSTGLLPRGISDPATVDCLLDLGGDINNEDDRLKDLEPPNRDDNNNSNKIDPSASSSFGSSSSSSSPSMSNLAPIRVRVVEEQFAQLDLSSANPPQITATPPPIGADQGLVMNHRGCSDDERSEQGVPVGFRKPPLPLQPLQQNKLAGFGGAGPVAGFSLPSPDSVTSDCSITSANSFCKPLLYQDNMAPASPNTKSEVSDPTSQIQTQHQALDPNYMPDHQQQQQQQVPDPNYMIGQQQQQQQQQVPDPNYMIGQQQQQQQQFVRYIPHTANTGAVPVSSYYQIYAQPPQQQQQYHQPVYVMPMSHTQSYMSMQPDHPAGPATHPPVYPAKPAQPAMVNTPPLLQVPPNQFQQQFVGYAQAHGLTQPGGPGYGFEYSNPHPDQVYYAQAQVPQYQTMTPAAMAALTDAANQINTNTGQ